MDECWTGLGWGTEIHAYELVVKQTFAASQKSRNLGSELPLTVTVSQCLQCGLAAPAEPICRFI